MRGMTRKTILAAVCVAALVGGYGARAQDHIDTTSLPRGEGTRVLRAHPASTSFITPATVEEAGEAYRKILAEAGWQQYDQMAASHPMPTRIMRFKKGAQGLSVVIMPSPTQGGATSVNYTAELDATERPEPPAGKFKVTLEVANGAAQNREFEVAAEETWGLLVGPAGSRSPSTSIERAQPESAGTAATRREHRPVGPAVRKITEDQ